MTFLDSVFKSCLVEELFPEKLGDDAILSGIIVSLYAGEFFGRQLVFSEIPFPTL